MKHIAAIVPVMLVGVIGFACGSSDSGGGVTPPTSDAGPTTEPTEGGAVGESLTIGVETVADGVARNVPFAGGKVTFHKPTGEDIETTVDAQGLVKVDGIDWSKGRASATVYGDGHLPVTFVDLDKTTIPTTNYTTASKTAFTAPKPDLVLFAIPKQATLVNLTGHITNPQGTYVTLTDAASNGFWQNKNTASFSLGLTPNEATKLFLLDWTPGPGTAVGHKFQQTLLNWFELDQPAVSAATTRDIDISTLTPSAVTKVKGTIKIPGGTTGPLGANSLGVIVVGLAKQQTALIGAVSNSDINGDATGIDYDLQYIQPATEKPLSQFIVVALPDTTVRTTFWTKQYIADGYVADTLLEIPTVTASPTKTLASPITASNLPSGAALRLSLFDDAGDQTGLVVGPPNVSSITPPKLTGAAATAVGKIATAAPVFVTDLDDELDYFFRNSTGPSFDVK